MNSASKKVSREVIEAKAKEMARNLQKREQRDIDVIVGALKDHHKALGYQIV